MILPELGNSKLLAEEVISLPMGPWMNDDQITYVCQVLADL
jgi:dTDP-4-amino-4,6-dideoxygalactose transaminase